ncbi:hypothetical protein L0U85_14385 [Glycomyces sp. L485]|uniref:hypothetical protein n=1 Tax=Glycomyces sp. L485 TaxID=2909235 RepID=UPI001F4B2A81|nr:hypothetical protein [Glycomyces sp. L485]MCH7232034.1 hypothetical protein [Glycomyces sp. L485]
MVLLGGTAVSAAPEAPGSIGIRLVEESVHPADSRSRHYIVDHVAPGDEIRREMDVQNASSDAVHIELYPVAASVEDDRFTAAEGRGTNDLSEWTTLDESSLDLEPGESVRVGATIAVPASAYEGERYAAVLAEVAADDGDIRQIHRVGIRMYLSVGPGGEPATDFQIDGMSVVLPPGADWPVLVARVANTGERAVDLSGSASLQRASGTVSAGPFAVDAGVTILPGDTGQVRAVLGEPLPAGEWTAEMTLAADDVERTAEADVTIPARDSEDSGFPWVLVVFAAAALGIAGYALVRLRRAT